MTFIARHPKRTRLLIVFTAYLTGLAVGSLTSQYVSDYLLYVALVLAGGFLVLRNYTVRVSCLALAALMTGYWWAGSNLEALTLTEPYRYQGSATLTSLRYGQNGSQRAALQLEEGDRAGRSIQAYVFDWTYELGTVLEITASITPSKYVSNYGRNVMGESNSVTVRSVVADPNWLYRFRRLLQQRMGASLPEPHASLAIGLLTGTNDAFDSEFKEDLQRTGTSHLVAVSGYNLTLVALLLQRLGQRKHRYIGFALACGGILVYVLLAGGAPSILRGAIVAFLSLFAVMAGRLTHRLNLLLMSAVLLSLITPLGMLYSLSWQLSFLAFAGIVFMNPLIGPWLVKRLPYIGASLGETLSAQILVLPLLLYEFNLLSIISPFVNVAVLAVTPLAMGLSALQAVLSLIALELGQWFVWISYPVLVLIVSPIQWASTIPFAAVSVTSYAWPYVAASYGAIASLFAFFALKPRKYDGV